MQKYQILSKAGSGNFSDVYRARNRLTDQIVAIKQMKHCQDLQQLTFKELQILSTLNHPNIIKVKQVIKQKEDIKVVFQYMDETLLELYQSCRYGINENQIKCILYQSAFALDYLHKHRFIHRDIKPENILINRKLALIKLIDFGLAKQDYLASTDYVATRWYRAPENLLGLRNSSTSMDIFALGCVIVQLFTLNPLFPGEDTVDQLHKITNILGSPTMQNWPQGYKQAQRKGINLGSRLPISLKFCMPTASNQLVDLLEQMLHLNPIHRMSARQIMNHPFFQKVQRVIPQHIYKEVSKAREQYQSKKARKISPLNYSPVNQLNGIHAGFFSKPQMKSMTAAKTNQSFTKDSRLSIQNKSFAKEPPIAQSKDSYMKILGNNWEYKKSFPNMTAYPTTKNPAQNITQRDQEKVRNYFSRDHYTPTANLSVQKRSPYQNNLSLKTNSDQTKINSRANMDPKQPKGDDHRTSPRYKVKYFKQVPKEINIIDRNRNIGMSLQSGYNSKNKTVSHGVYATNPLVYKGFRKEYI